MANPTFDNTALTAAAAHNRIGCREARAYTEAVPGCNGLYAQPHGTGGRALAADGLLTATGASATAARAAVMNAFRQREALADGDTVATFTGTDGEDYDHCILQSYTHGAVQVAKTGDSTYTAYLPVHAQLLQLVP